MENRIREAVEKGNNKYWEDAKEQERLFQIWIKNKYEGRGPQVSKGSIVDYITEEVMLTLKQWNKYES